MGRLKNIILLGAGGIFFFILGGVFFAKSGVSPQISPVPKVEGVENSSSPTPPGVDLVEVTRVIDGDTIEIESGRKLRLIGIDASELNKTGETGCFGKEAAEYTTKLLGGQMVRLEKDVSDVDRYNRLLRYVYLRETMINERLVREGFAKVATYPPDVKYKDKFLQAEKDARENRLGLWSKCNHTTPLRSGVVTPTAGIDETGERLNINCTSNTYNCSDFKTQAEAQSTFDYCRKSVGYDVHKLDRDNDGRVCETLP